MADPESSDHPARRRRANHPAAAATLEGKTAMSTVVPVSNYDSKQAAELENLETDLLLEAIFRHYGYDFREYARASLKRRVHTMMRNEGLRTISALTELLLHDRAAFNRFLLVLSVNVTSVFRDPEFFLAFRRLVVPMLRTYPFIRIWHAGCSTGEEVYSMAILLQEEGLYDKCRLYATDMDEAVLKQASQGIFPLESAEQYAANYRRAGGMQELTDYYTGAYGNGMFRASLRGNIVFSQHNLAMDRSFNEFNVILCRNVMIYFTKQLQFRVHELLYDSLAMFGVLGLGAKETIHFSPHEKDYEHIEAGARLYRKIA